MDRDRYFEHVDESAAWLRDRVTIEPRLLVVLSGGLHAFVDHLEQRQVFATEEIPDFPASRAEGHHGNLVFGKLGDVPLVAMQGRQHLYEGYTPHQIIFPYFVLNELGVGTLVTTNAVGGVREDLHAGDVMLVTDHINMLGVNPLVGLTVQRKQNQFPNMTRAYDPGLRALAKRIAAEKKIPLKEGVYVATIGPSYETPAEIAAFRRLGGDAVGMSTVLEVIAANFLGMRVLTFSAIANPAADRHGGEMSHAEVLNAMQRLAPRMVDLLQGIVAEL